MAYVITVKEDNRILEWGAKLDFMSNGYPRLVNENVAFPTFMVYVNGKDVSDRVKPKTVIVPEGVEPEKWCYTIADGFYENPNWEDPDEQ